MLRVKKRKKIVEQKSCRLTSTEKFCSRENVRLKVGCLKMVLRTVSHRSKLTMKRWKREETETESVCVCVCVCECVCVCVCVCVCACFCEEREEVIYERFYNDKADKTNL
jgi:hypothetical protein